MVASETGGMGRLQGAKWSSRRGGEWLRRRGGQWLRQRQGKWGAGHERGKWSRRGGGQWLRRRGDECDGVPARPGDEYLVARREQGEVAMHCQ